MPGATTLERIESHVPDRTVTVADLAGRLNLDRSHIGVLRKLQGLRELRYDPDQSLFDLVLPAARRAVANEPEKSAIKFVLFVHATQAVTPSHIDAARVLRDSLDLPGAEAFAVTQQNCAATLVAIDLAGELLRAEGGSGSRALIVTGEKAFTPEIQLIPQTTIFGDAAAACVVGVAGPGDPIRSYATRTFGEYSGGLRMSRELAPEIGQIYHQTMAEVILEAIAKAGLELSDVDLVLPHNVNALSWWQIAKILQVERDRVFLDNVPRYSHTFTSDVLVNYASARDSERLVPGRHYVLAANGVGSTFSAMVFTHQGR
jgi:3-oxoacyl-[acyl-carrier-protein] synthase III